MKKGVIEAPRREEAEESLLEQDLTILSLRDNAPSTMRQFGIPMIGGVSSSQRIFFTRHLAALTKSGMSLVEALEVIGEETSSSSFRKMLRDLIAAITNGSTLSYALSRHPKIFDRFYVHVVEIAEESGTLEENLEYIAVQLEKTHDLKRRFIAAMIYPAIILALAVVIAGGLVVFILPKLLPVFSSFDIELPLTTKILIGISVFMQDYGLVTLFGVVGGVILLRLLSAIGPVGYLTARMTLLLPVFGPLVKYLNLTFFARTMETLIKSGVSLMNAVEISADSMGNAAYRKKTRSFLGHIREGRGLGDAFRKEKTLFPVMFSRMVAVGERSGKLDDSFHYLAVFYEKEVDSITTNLSNVLQPALLIVVGLVVGFIAIALITPIYKFTGSIRR